MNCSSANTSVEVVADEPDRAVVDNLKPSTVYTCRSTFVYQNGYAAYGNEITFRTKLPGEYIPFFFRLRCTRFSIDYGVRETSKRRRRKITIIGKGGGRVVNSKTARVTIVDYGGQ